MGIGIEIGMTIRMTIEIEIGTLIRMIDIDHIMVFDRNDMINDTIHLQNINY